MPVGWHGLFGQLCGDRTIAFTTTIDVVQFVIHRERMNQSIVIVQYYFD